MWWIEKANKWRPKNKQIPEACLKQVNEESAGIKKEKGDKDHLQKQYDCVK